MTKYSQGENLDVQPEMEIRRPLDIFTTSATA